MRLLLFVLSLFLSIAGLCQDKRPIRTITILREEVRHGLLPVKRAVLAKIHCDGNTITEVVPKADVNVESIAPFSPNDPYELKTSLNAILNEVYDTSRYHLSFDTLGRPIEAVERGNRPSHEAADQLMLEESRYSWSFQYDSNGVVLSVGAYWQGLRAGGTRRTFNEDGLEVKRENWHPRGFINATEITTYNKQGLPATKQYWFRGNVYLSKLIYAYSYY